MIPISIITLQGKKPESSKKTFQNNYLDKGPYFYYERKKVGGGLVHQNGLFKLHK